MRRRTLTFKTHRCYRNLVLSFSVGFFSLAARISLRRSCFTASTAAGIAASSPPRLLNPRSEVFIVSRSFHTTLETLCGHWSFRNSISLPYI